MTSATIQSSSTTKFTPSSVHAINGINQSLQSDGNKHKVDLSNPLFSSGENQAQKKDDLLKAGAATEAATASPQDTRSLSNLTFSKTAHNNCFHFRTRSLPLTEEPFIEAFPSTSASSLSSSTSTLLRPPTNLEPFASNAVAETGYVPLSSPNVDQGASGNGLSIIDQLCSLNSLPLHGSGSSHLLQTKMTHSHAKRYQRLLNYSHKRHVDNYGKLCRDMMTSQGVLHDTIVVSNTAVNEMQPAEMHASSSDFVSPSASTKTTTITTTVATIACTLNTVTIGTIHSIRSRLSSSAIAKSAGKGARSRSLADEHLNLVPPDTFIFHHWLSLNNSIYFQIPSSFEIHHWL